MTEIEPASGEWLDYIARRQALVRMYYGDNPDVKPNEDCIWYDDGWYFKAGWHESDANFRARYEMYRKEML